ncbi:MAG TPA: MlaD family protein [Steroidobacteraceae bacterium]|nr:MlaD family protein [Steroidobacteraceae bacterium]
MERDAKYVAVAVFALSVLAAAFAFVWWYSGKGDRREYELYEVYFDGSVSGLAQGSPVRYLGVDVGRVESLRVDTENPGRVKILAEIDSTAPISGATRARLGLLGLTGLLYIDLQLEPDVDSTQPLAKGDRYPVILSRKGDIEAFLERLPDLVGDVGAVVERIERVLSDENIAAVRGTLAALEETSRGLPAVASEAQVLLAELRRVSGDTGALLKEANGLLESSGPELAASLDSLRTATERVASLAASAERVLSANESSLAGFAGSSLFEFQQLLVDLRQTSAEVQRLASSLQENPSMLLREREETGVEIAP